VEVASGAAKRLPILALTADAMVGMSERCASAGMDGYLTKPIVRDALIAELETWLPVAFDLRTAAESPAKDAAAPVAADAAEGRESS
jgi:CheY-like chemotaxis protein